ncbi:MAG: peptidylprolyl isomerase [Chlamydiia bacterium]|nr:peptidylprolyl isomerase [Chlamydiia bacterium]MCP5509881.1 peptidylprolyl isomerase [Chlamydiales bacterium]HPE85511.1 peptidylprolyl isomerase [Chlamydiales bacterium]
MQENPIVVFETNQGSIEIELMPKVAPKTCENMLNLIKKNYYDGVTFHRVIKDFMIQGGDPTATGAGGESSFGKEFKDEISSAVRFTEPGLLAMANRGPNTNGSQFFITTKSTPHLNGNHTIFGKVVKGYDVVQKIENAKTTMQDRPIEVQKIVRAYIKEES